MKKKLLLCIALACSFCSVFAQTTILNFEAPLTSTVFQYFESSLNGQFTQVINNPSATGINTSSKVSNFIKPAVATVIAGAFSDPNPSVQVVVTGGALIKVKVRMNHIGNLALKLEQSTSGQPDWIKIVNNTQINQWQELTYNTALPSDEAPGNVPTGTYQRITLFFDFGSPGTGADVTSYFDDIRVFPASFQPLSATVTTTDVSCNGGNNGTIMLSVTGGSSNYTYNWGGGVTTQNRSGLTAGTYNVTVTDAAANLTLTQSVVITQPTPVTASATTTNVTCFGSANGIIELDAAGGTAGYTYNWGSGITGDTRTNLAPGTYTATVSDANSCTTTISRTITQPTALASAATVTNVDCFGGQNGVISLNPSGGTAGYSYSWSDGANDQIRTDLYAGTYSVTITDANNCTTVLSRNVTQPTALAVVATATNVGCFGNTTGTISLNTSGGTAGYNYLWDNGATTASVTGLSAGTYTATVTDTRGCTATNSQTLTEPSSALSTSADVDNATCFGTPTGAITLETSGGTANYTYVWSGSSANTAVRTDLPAGEYFATITDANGCTTSIFEIITEPTALAASALVTAPTCTNPAGSITVNVTGGTTGYTFLWNDGATTQNRNNVPAGTYNATVTDFNGCTNTVTSTIMPSADALVAAASSTNVACFGNATGAIVVSVSSGTAPYTFNWGNGITTQNRSNLNAGSYTVTVTDNNNCTTTVTKIIAEPATALAAAAATTHVDCFGNLTGTITISPNGGTAPYAFTWDNGSNAPTRTGLGAGTYEATVTDGNGCTSELSTSITQPNNALAASATATDVDCFGNATGSVSLGANGGSPGYSYNWGNGITAQTRTGLAAGTYTATITDVNGCTAAVEKTVNQPATALTAVATATNVLCNGAANGSANMSVSGGTAGYTFNWSNGANIAMVSGLAAGTYNVTVTDAQNCSTTAAVSISQPSVLSSTASATAQTANNVNNGTATVIPDGGTAGYAYNWNNGGTTQTITGLAPGIYTVVVTDANGCTTSQIATVNSYNCNLMAAISTINSTCFGANNGSASVSIQGATMPISYTWSNGGTQASIAGLAPGMYVVGILDANGCFDEVTATVAEPMPLNASATATNPTANGVNDGTVTASPAGGTAPYAYAWSNGGNTQTIANLAPGTYSVVITDANGCSTESVATVAAFGCFLQTSSMAENVSCAGAANGQATVTVTGGAAPYLYTWSNGQTASTISGLSGGTYVVNILDELGCETSTSINIVEPSALGASLVNQTNVVCANEPNGTATALAQGGTMPYAYNWSNGSTTATATGLLPGAYSAVVTDANGCMAITSAVITANDTQAPVLTCPASITRCADQNTVAYQYPSASDNCSGTGGTWDLPAGLPSGSMFPVGVTTQVFTFTDASGNVGSCTFDVTIQSPSVAGAVEVSGCFQACAGNVAATAVTGGQAPYTYLWSNNANTATISGLCDANNLGLTITDAGGCATTQTINVTVPPALALATPSVTNDANGQNVGAIGITVQGGVAPYTYKWTKNGNAFATSEDLTNIGAGTYVVVITDANGCIVTSENIVVDNVVGTDEPEWAIGMLMSPNPTDGQLQIRFATIPQGEMAVAIIDATGRVVFQTTSINVQMMVLDLAHLPVGIYAVRMQSDDQMGVRALVINR